MTAPAFGGNRDVPRQCIGEEVQMVMERGYSRLEDDGGLSVDLDGAASGSVAVLFWDNDGNILTEDEKLSGSDSWDGDDALVGAYLDDLGNVPFIRVGIVGALRGVKGHIDAWIELSADGARQLADDLLAAAALIA